MILQYAEGRNFNYWLNKNSKYFNWLIKLKVLINIINGLKEIHQKQMVHRDFHIGNILFKDLHLFTSNYISDMGLCGEIGNIDEDCIYGVMPYIAPEVLRGKPYTQAADIYSFAMIMYFVATERQPFDHCAHDHFLVLDVCRGIRPEIIEPEAPKCFIDLMKKCWDSNPINRPNANEIEELIISFYKSYCPTNNIKRDDDEIEEQFKEAEKYRSTTYNKTIKPPIINVEAVFTSRLLNPFTKKIDDLPELLDDNIQDLNKSEKSECLDCEINKQ
jgi:serine/threonine protein kinase